VDGHVAADRRADRRRVDNDLLRCDACRAVLHDEVDAQTRDVLAVGRDRHGRDDGAGQLVAVARGSRLSERELDLERRHHARCGGRGDQCSSEQPERAHHPNLLLE